MRKIFLGLVICLSLIFPLLMWQGGRVCADERCTDPYAEGYQGCGTGQPCECKGSYHSAWTDKDRPDVPTNCKHMSYRCRSYCRQSLCSCEPHGEEAK